MAQFEETLYNEPTGETALIKSNDYQTFEEKKRRKLEVWSRKNIKLQGLEETNEANRINNERIEAIQKILLDTLEVDDKINWEALYEKDSFKRFV